MDAKRFCARGGAIRITLRIFATHVGLIKGFLIK